MNEKLDNKNKCIHKINKNKSMKKNKLKNIIMKINIILKKL